MRSFGFIIGMSVFATAAVFAQQSARYWMPMGRSANSTYHVSGYGDPLNPSGATLHINADKIDNHLFGSVAHVVDAAAFKGHRVTFAASLNVRDAAQGAELWLRADGADHARGALAIANSPILLSQVPADAPANTQDRQVSIDVPNEATRLFFGLILKGKGEVTASHARLNMGEHVVEVRPQILLDQVVKIVRAHALHSEEVNWPVVEPQIRAMAANAVVARDVYPAIRALLKALNDHHSFLMPPDAAAHERNSVTTSGDPTVALRAGVVGYINVPGYRGLDRQAHNRFATTMVNAIADIATQTRCGWIVDLRQNTGGNMLPMLGGLRPLLGNTLGIGFRDAHGKVDHPSVGVGLDASVPHGPDLSRAPVAVLTGPRTGSSGEVVAIAFRGRPATRSFGSATYGLSTGNSAYPLADGSLLLLATAIDLDRTGKAYGGKLEPDQTVVTLPDTSTDTVMDAAQAWLIGLPGCSR